MKHITSYLYCFLALVFILIPTNTNSQIKEDSKDVKRATYELTELDEIMLQEHPKYKLKESDTKQTITSLFEVEESVWVSYHNERCGAEEVINEGLPKELSHIYILPELWDKEEALNSAFKEKTNLEIHNEKVKFGVDNSIIINQVPEKRRYRTKIENLETNTRVDFEVLAEKIDREGEDIRMKFTKDNIYTYGYKPVKVMDKIAVKVVQAIYPICLEINLRGYTRIENPEQLYSSWPEVRQEIEKEYTGRNIQAYLDKTEAGFLDEDLKFNILDNDIFFGLFSHSIYGAYNDSLEIENLARLSLGAYNSARNFRGKQWVEPTYNNVQGVFVYYKGYAKGRDPKTKEIVNYELNIKYNLAYKTFSIKDILAEVIKHDTKGSKVIQRVSIHQLRRFEEPSEEKQNMGEEYAIQIEESTPQLDTTPHKREVLNQDIDNIDEEVHSQINPLVNLQRLYMEDYERIKLMVE